MSSATEEKLVEDSPPSIDPYEVLGVDPQATADQVKSSYRKQALKHHPGIFILISFQIFFALSTS